MAKLTPHQLLGRIVDVCTEATIVTAYTIRTLDLDVLSMRVHLIGNSFIEVFFNVTSEKTAFALILDKDRVYGKDNAKVGWHVHPIDDPGAHHPCEAVSFEEFLAEVEMLPMFSSDNS